MRYLKNVVQKKTVQLSYDTCEVGVIELRCPKCRSITKGDYSRDYDDQKKNIFPKYCCYCGCRLIEKKG